MSQEASDPLDGEQPPSPDPAQGAVIVGVIPDQPVRVLKEAARYAKLLGAHLLVVYVDVTRFVTYEDPDGYVHATPIDVTLALGEGEFAAVKASAAALLDGHDLDWSARQLVGDPALSIKHLADQIDAKLLVVGTRKRGLGESIREFFTGAVAARLAHRQHRPILVVPLGEPVPDDQDIWPDRV
ncbi:universal stress protein [Microbacterium rhizomatis]|uniref:Universal stress protein n=1 Tax=Microbacterium rhizomatis TaxID=1631477 RepID=A0A5J5IZF4_9MICO|nr:universal stress protein [Microbacterium rhizomatis]KAA9106617.1 universal stress protein [Microbacterium rhizomatis]